MKVEYDSSSRRRKPPTALEQQVVHDYLTGVASWGQAWDALGLKTKQNFSHRIVKVVVYWAKTGNLVIKKKNYDEQ